MTTIERIDNEIRSAMAEYSSLTKRTAVVSPKAGKLAKKIKDLQQRRDNLIAGEQYTLASVLPKDGGQRNEIYRMLLKLPIIADFMYSACVDLRSRLESLGLNELTMTRQVRQMSETAKRLAFTLSEFTELENILSADDTLIGALDRKVNDFLTRRMDITD